ncbi:hypothetical protein OAZ24_01170 [Synechococcus sp. AH-736-G21]|nr:hypothetical protein [Synechococcus sp. AH-736-G21]
MEFNSFFNEQNWSPRHIPNDCSQLGKAELVALAIEETKALDEAGKTKTAVLFLDACIAAGLPAEWLQYHKAGYLSKTDSFEEAQTIWKDLVSTGESPNLIKQCEKALKDSKRQQATENSASTLLEKLHALAKTESWTFETLHTINEDANPEDITTLIIKESFHARRNNHPGLSLDLLDTAIEAGLESPWLLENKAQSLSALEHFEAAHALWNELIGLEDKPKLVETAQKALLASKEKEEEAIKDKPLRLIDQFHQIAKSYSYIPEHLPSREQFDLEQDLNTIVIKESFSARRQKKNKLSLDLINEALDNGLDSAWLLDNKAQTLVKLGDFESAKEIWETLVTLQGKPKLVDTAQQSLDCLEESKRQYEEERPRQLIKQFQDIANQHHWNFKDLPRVDELDKDTNVELICLKEAIQACNQDNPKLSIVLLDAIMDLGYQSPWLNHNKAIALLKSGKSEQAIRIWKNIQKLDNKNITKKADEFLQIAYKQEKIDHASTLAELGRIDTAIEFLLDTIHQNPNAIEYNKKLKQLIIQDLGEESKIYEEDPALGDYIVRVKINERLIRRQNSKPSNQ